MSYSITPMLYAYVDANGLSKITIQVIVDRKKYYHQTSFKVRQDQFNGEVVNHPHAKKINFQLKSKVVEIEGRLIDAITKGADIKEAVTGQVDSKGLFFDFVTGLLVELKGKYSVGTLKHYKSLGNKVDEYSPDVPLVKMNVQFIQGFEGWLRGKGIDGNTVQSNCKMLKAILNKAANKDLIDSSQFAKYKVPKYEQKMAEYLTEDEVDKVFNLVRVLGDSSRRTAGYYFLLSCYTGFRISDSLTFNYDKLVRDGSILLRAKKNKQIVSIPIYPKLQEVLDYVKDNPIGLSEQKVRDYVKDICALVGIKKHVKFHTSRHSFAVMLRNKGFDRDEVSELIGDSKEVAAIYDVITNKHLGDKVRRLL